MEIYVALFLCLFAWQAEAASGVVPPVVALSTTTAQAALPDISTYPWRTEPRAPFDPGENLQFVIKWGVVVAGYSNLMVEDISVVEHRPTYHIVSTAHASGMVSAFYRVEDQNDVWLDQSALVTVRYEKRIHEGKFQIEETSILDQPHHRWKTRAYRLDKNIYEEKEGDLPANALDTFGSLYYVRTLPLKVGQTYTLDVHDGYKVYPLTVNVLKREKVKVPAGKFNCVLVEPFLRGPGIFISKGKKLEVWLTDDERHMPVRMRSEVFIGHVSAELTQYSTELSTTSATQNTSE